MINKDQYIHIANLVAEIQDLGDLSLAPLSFVKETLFGADINPQDRFRREFFTVTSATYSFLATNYSSPNQAMQGFVRSLNQHVLDTYGYSAIEEFLIAEQVVVPQSFADISTYIGFPIDNSLIGVSPPTYWQDFQDFWPLQGAHWDIWGS